MVEQLKAKKYTQGVIQGVFEIGQILDRFYDDQIEDLENELGNAPIILN